MRQTPHDWQDWPVTDRIQFGVLYAGDSKPTWSIPTCSGEDFKGKEFIEGALKANPDAKLVWRDLDRAPFSVYRNPYHPEESNDNEEGNNGSA